MQNRDNSAEFLAELLAENECLKAQLAHLKAGQTLKKCETEVRMLEMDVELVEDHVVAAEKTVTERRGELRDAHLKLYSKRKQVRELEENVIDLGAKYDDARIELSMKRARYEPASPAAPTVSLPSPSPSPSCSSSV